MEALRVDVRKFLVKALSFLNLFPCRQVSIAFYHPLLNLSMQVYSSTSNSIGNASRSAK